MIHYHGSPITPRAVLTQLAGRCFCVSYIRPDDLDVCLEIGQSVMLDNGAFSVWRRGATPCWPGFYEWVEPLLSMTTWAVIPDVIDGDETDNDALLMQWPHGQAGAPVWHMHESLARLVRLCENWSSVCIGSSGRYATVGDSRWRHRMDAAMNTICDEDGRPPCWLHMLRGMALAGSEYPFASVDSTDIAVNHARPKNDALQMALRWDRQQCATRWVYREQQVLTA